MKLIPREMPVVAWADLKMEGDSVGLSWTQGVFHNTPLVLATDYAAIMTERDALRAEVAKEREYSADAASRVLKAELAERKAYATVDALQADVRHWKLRATVNLSELDHVEDEIRVRIALAGEMRDE